MPRRPSTKMLGHGARSSEQLPLPAQPSPAPPTKPKASIVRAPEAAAKVAIARRTKPSSVPGYVKIMLTLDIPRELAERLSTRAIREGKNLEAVVIEILDAHPRH